MSFQMRFFIPCRTSVEDSRCTLWLCLRRTRRLSNCKTQPNPSVFFESTLRRPRESRLRPLPAMAPGALTRLLRVASTPRMARPFAAKSRASRRPQDPELPTGDENDFAGSEVAAPTESIDKPLAEVLKELGKRVPDSLVKTRVEDNGFTMKYIPW